MKNKSQISAFFTRLRNSRRWSQSSMAKITGVDQSTWARYETGERWPTLEVIQKLKRFLKIPEERSLLNENSSIQYDTESLSDADRSEMKYLWKGRIQKLNRKIGKLSRDLDVAIGRRAVFAEELLAIELKLVPALESLAFLKQKKAKPEVIEFLQQQVDEFRVQQSHAKASYVFFTNTQLKLMATDLECMQRERDFFALKLEELK